MMNKHSFVPLFMLCIALGLLYFFNGRPTEVNSSDYELLAVADYGESVSRNYLKDPSTFELNDHTANIQRDHLAKVSEETTQNLFAPAINAVAIGKFLNNNLPATTPVGNNAVPTLLSQTGAFTNLITLEPSPGLIPYDMIEPFWSDGADKKRWMVIPNDGTHNTPGEQIQFSPDNAWDFPKGAVLIKHFEFPGNRLETRFEVKGDDDVYYYLTYKWNAAQTDAVLLNASVDEDIVVNGVTQSWHYPSRNECASCHFPQNGSVLGPKTRNLNKPIVFPSSGIAMNQLVNFSELGIITENITPNNVTNYMAVSAKGDLNASLEDRARSYFDVNCSSCHNPQVDNVALFDARYTTPLENQNIIYGDVIYDEGLNDPKVIIPQDVSNSMAHFRMNSTQTGIEMPPLAKDVVDTEGVQLIADWINSLTPTASNLPIAAFSASTTYGPAPMNVSFDASDSSDPNGDALTYSWTFGDGTSGQGAFVNHVYQNPGSYTATLNVSDGQGSDQETTSIIVTDPSPGTNTVAFTDGTSLVGQNNYSGLPMGVIDMNGDGKDDIVQFNSAKNLRIQYQNAAGQTFTSYNFGQVSTRNQWSTAIADYDQNGYNDIISGGAYDNIKLIKNNNGNNSFTMSTLQSSNIFIQGSNFVDINNDGWADIFACHDDAESRAYQNNQNGTFAFNANLISTETTPTSDNSGNYASMWIDYDNDRDLDLYISKCRGGVTSSSDPRRINMLWQNDGNNNFTEVAGQANLKIGDQTWLTDFGDIDNDGDLDAIVINHGTGPKLMRNNGNGTFSDVTAGSGLLPTLTPQNFYGIQGFFRDFNNDGHLDLMVSGDNHYIFYNNGNGTFQNASNPFNSNQIQSFSVGDLNHDGFLDIYAGYASGLNSPTSTRDRIWLNQGNSNNFLNIQLKGTQSNINGIGARVEIYGAWGIQIRDVRSGEGYGLVNSFTQHFGIGVNTQVDRVIVRWPSGVVDEISNPAINQFLSIIEGEGEEECTADSDNDGVCDADDICEGGDDNIDSDGDGIPDFCDTSTCEEVTVTINFDNYADEVSWSIIDANGAIVLSGDNYTTTNNNGTVSDSICLEDGCYDFSIEDDYGDGICCSEGQGSYSVTDASGNVLASGGSYTTSETTNFCLNEPIVPVTGIEITETGVALLEGTTQQLTATVVPGNATDLSISWSSSDDSIAVVDSSGEVTALTQGTAIVTATTTDGSFQATSVITVQRASVNVTGVNVTPDTAILFEGATQQLTATVAPSNADDTSVSWSSSNEVLATVDANGLVSANAQGTVTIIATTTDGGFQDTVVITIERVAVNVTGVAVAPDTTTLLEGATQQLIATIVPSNADNPSASWSSSNEAIATVDANGLVNAIAQGTATITATTTDGGLQATSTITVETSTVPISVYNVTITPITAELNVGETFQLSATVEPSNATDQSVSWFSNDPTIATIDPNTGLVTGVGVGEIDVTAVTNDGGFRTSAIVNVTGTAPNVSVYNVTVAPTSIDLNVGETFQLNATLAPADATDQSVNWFSNNPEIATIDPVTGLVTATGAGEIDVTAVTNDGGYRASAIINVTGTPPIVNVYDVTLSPARIYANVGNTLQFNVDIQPFNATDQTVTWFSNNTAIASIDPVTGLVTATGAGIVDITAVTNDGGFNASATVEVFGTPASVNVYNVAITTAAIALNVGETYQLTADIEPSNATNQSVSWFSNNTAVATIDPNTGWVTAVGEGETDVTVITADGGYQASSIISVTPPSPNLSLYPNPTSGTLNIDLSDYMGMAVEMQLFNQNSQLLGTTFLDQNHGEVITVSYYGYPEGYYYLSFRTLYGVETRSFIIRY